ncbi:MAG: sensor domain-containing diguanylate cyclase [Clostridiales Family XIII bacterium]|nr:sensor domain-containing diguanylate cyclase [Clostridiales Family XIII bacterium]
MHTRSVGRRLTMLIILMIVVISAVMMFIGYTKYKDSEEEYYFRMGETTAGIVAMEVDPDSLDTYLETLTTDKNYDDTMTKLRKAREICGAQALYIFQVKEDGINYIYDTDPSDMWCELGYFDPYEYKDDNGKDELLYPNTTKKELQRGGDVDTIMGITQYGWTITVNYPLYNQAGICKGYVGIDLNVDKIVAERQTYLRNLSIIILITTAAFAIIYLIIMRKSIINPINEMSKAADSFLINNSDGEESIDDSAILSLDIHTKDELQNLSEALKSMVQKINKHLTDLHLVTIKSETDGLTKLLNRGAFEQQVNAVLHLRTEKDQKDAFMMIDVDYFKTVNDTYGHAVGDMVLTQCAQALRRVMRESDIVGRLGGDEFAVYCRSISTLEMAEKKAQQIREEWLKIIPLGGEKGITASIGIAFPPKDGEKYQDLFNAADDALYRAKEAGRDRYAI